MYAREGNLPGKVHDVIKNEARGSCEESRGILFINIWNGKLHSNVIEEPRDGIASDQSGEIAEKLRVPTGGSPFLLIEHLDVPTEFKLAEHWISP